MNLNKYTFSERTLFTMYYIDDKSFINFERLEIFLFVFLIKVKKHGNIVILIVLTFPGRNYTQKIRVFNNSK